MNVAVSDLVESINRAKLPPPARRREIRQLAGATLRDLASVVGVSPMTIARFARSFIARQITLRTGNDRT